ncbi:VOC family protein [Novosphingobium aerophilum]|uniref:VOC family protein n=1 Tax=Novosphingobium aerophilum TaxID=2839843 RepID=UPI001C8F3C0D
MPRTPRGLALPPRGGNLAAKAYQGMTRGKELGMGIAGIDHVNIRTMDPESSAQFYERALGLVYRPGPAVMGNRSHWLYDDEGNAVIHFREKAADTASTGAIDHVALRCSNRPAMKARLDGAGIQYAEADHITPGLAQIFLMDPHGVALELNFAEPRHPD